MMPQLFLTICAASMNTIGTQPQVCFPGSYPPHHIIKELDTKKEQDLDDDESEYCLVHVNDRCELGHWLVQKKAWNGIPHINAISLTTPEYDKAQAEKLEAARVEMEKKAEAQRKVEEAKREKIRLEAIKKAPK